MLHAMPADSDTAIVAFSAKGGVFDYFRVLQPFPGITKLLVRDPSDRWYNAGLPGVGDSVDAVADRVGAELDAVGAKRVITLGSSMGGYAAILFGCMLGAERAIAFGPQTILDPIFRHSPPTDVPLQVPDLRPIVREHPDTAVELVAGWDSMLDVFHAQRLAGMSSVRVIGVMGGIHTFVIKLHGEGKLVPLVEELIEGRVPAFCEVEPTLSPDTAQRIADAVVAWHSGDHAHVVDRLGVVTERHPGWPGVQALLDEALDALGEA